MALTIKENEFVILCVHVPGATEEELLVPKVSLNGKEFFDFPQGVQGMAFHPEVKVLSI